MYIGVGEILDAATIIIHENTTHLIRPTTQYICYIRSINAEPISKTKFGNLYNIEDVVYDGPYLLYDVSTIATLFDLGLITHDYTIGEETLSKWYLLNELIQLPFDVSEDVLDYIYEDAQKYDENSYDINTLLFLADNKAVLRWLLKKGAKFQIVNGWGNSMEILLQKNNKELIKEALNYKDALDLEVLKNYEI